MGALIGGLLLALAQLPLTPLFAAALAVGFWVWVTGALHLDGLADSVDGWVGGLGDRAKTLAIMKDPRSGPMAVAALVLVLLLKVAAVEMLLRQTTLWPLVVAPVLGRAAMVLALVTTPYVRPQGMGAIYRDHLPPKACIYNVIIASSLLLILQFTLTLVALGAALLLFWRWRVGLLQRLGGMTGDTLGALCELTELGVLIICCLFLGFASLLALQP